MAKGLFGGRFSKEKEQDSGGCCNMEIIEEDDEVTESPEISPASGDFVIKVYGPGCNRCEDLKNNVLQALSEADKAADFEYVTDMERLASTGIMATPALEMNGKIVSSGKVLKAKDIAKLL